MQQIIFIRLKLQPSPTIGNHACVVSTTTVLILLILKINTWATNNLVNNDPFGTVNDERSTFSHQWKFSNKNFLFFDFAGFFINQTASHIHL